MYCFLTICCSSYLFSQEAKSEDLASPFVDEMIQSIKVNGKVKKKTLAVLEVESGKKFTAWY